MNEEINIDTPAAVAEFPLDYVALFNNVFDNVNEAVRLICEAIKHIFKNIANIANELFEIWKNHIPRKWWHLYKHAKKARVRKKYYNRIFRFIAQMAANGGST